MPNDNTVVMETKLPGQGAMEFLRDVEQGALIEQLEDDIKALVTILQDQSRNQGGKPKGTVTIQLKIVLDRGIFEVTAATEVKNPKPVRGRTIFYRGLDNLLTPHNPQQLSIAGMEPKDVTTTAVRAMR